MQLASGGRVLAGRRAGDPPLPAELRDALEEWAAVATAVREAGSRDEQDLVRRRGRQLASRMAAVLGRTVDYVDPVTGSAEPIEARPTVPIPREPPEPVSDRPAVRGAPAPRAAASAPVRHRLPVEPVPWATGLPIAAFSAVFVALADVVLSRAFAEAFGLLWVPANLLVGLGVAPSLWLWRHTPFWRWPVLGAAAGLAAAWVVLLLGMLA